MSKFSTLSFLLCFSFLSFAQNKNSSQQKTNLSDGVILLFKNVKSKLTDSEKNLVFQKLQLKLSKDKKQFMIDEFPVNVEVLPTDMNKDGKEEVFVGLESSALYGNVGKSFFLYIKNSEGIYQQHAEIGGGIPLVLSVKNLGYPDILIGGPGTDFPVYRWDGKKYLFNRKIKNVALKSDTSTDIETYSRLYTNTIP